MIASGTEYMYKICRTPVVSPSSSLANLDRYFFPGNTVYLEFRYAYFEDVRGKLIITCLRGQQYHSYHSYHLYLLSVSFATRGWVWVREEPAASWG